ncbi:helix-turn-helix transcriptional regulator [Streptomyces litchfieldiae]|uniref:Helix-turn-helix domain-containing protein n=1 Tax=Streptomyces litchfieldiae TaxID=3075543 RepID=A0ABU2N0S4_9ACTN|nr:helix-turn-helix domain-containing protein [Streptomyces sp. DSM 44938]MDT0347128.1 helix-turn-helix domain-containing protein [Streptomyces sp. DSM 44938]
MARLLNVAQVAELLTAASGRSSASAEPDLLHGGWYSTDEVADLIGVDASTLRRWRTASPPQGPPFVRLTTRVTMYSVPDVQAWLASRRIDPAKAA